LSIVYHSSLFIKKYRAFVMPGYCLELDEYFCLGYGGGRANLVVGLEMLKMALGELPRRLEIPNTSGDLGRYRYHLAPKPLQ